MELLPFSPAVRAFLSELSLYLLASGEHAEIERVRYTNAKSFRQPRFPIE